MGKINKYIVYTVNQVNFIFGMVGFSVFGTSFWLLFAQWGDIDASFFLGAGLLTLLFGLFLISLACLGCLSTSFQPKKIGVCTGRRVLTIYQLLLMLCFIAEIYFITLSLSAYTYSRSISTALGRTSLLSGDLAVIGPVFNSFETTLSQKFNGFFYGATSRCTAPYTPDLKYMYFWIWVEGHCTAGLSTTSCLRCDDYYVTQCYADRSACDENQYSDACPYVLCRRQILDWLIEKYGSYIFYVLAFTICHFLLIVGNLMMICYTPRDSLETILFKSGTIVQRSDQEQNSEFN